MARMLLVQHDRRFSEAFLNRVRADSTDEVECALNGEVAAKMIVSGQFEAALISATMPDASGIELAKLAVNENLPVLMLSDNRNVSEELRRLDFRYLEHPFTVEALLWESRQIAFNSKRNVSRAKSSLAKLEANLNLLKAEVAESNRLFDAIIARLGYWAR